MEPSGMPQSGTVRVSPKDFFLHLGIIVALYVSAISLLVLLFHVIDIALPDQLERFYYDPYSSGIRFAIASLIVFFPVYLVLGWLYQKELNAFPEKIHLAIRRWLVYLTLFITGLAIVGDLVVLLNSFLGGEITARFVLKVLSVLVVAGMIFAYYILSMRGKMERRKVFTAFAGAAIILVLGSLGYGFYYMGSPGAQRQLRFDNQRTGDLQNIQWQIVNYWQQKQTLPQNLADLSDNISGFEAPADPETKSPYQYEITSATGFRLCATFNRPSQNLENSSVTRPMYLEPAMENWKHGAGKTCFDRTIDPERYPPYDKSAIEKPIMR